MLTLLIVLIALTIITAIFAVFKENNDQAVHVAQYEHLISCAHLVGKSDEEIEEMKSNLIKIKAQYNM